MLAWVGPADEGTVMRHRVGRFAMSRGRRNPSGGLCSSSLASHQLYGATAGTLSLEQPTPTGATGSFDLTFRDGSLRGEFQATVCKVPVPISVDVTFEACAQ